jgi:cytochrome c oxidase cbb3-type subunit 3
MAIVGIFAIAAIVLSAQDRHAPAEPEVDAAKLKEAKELYGTVCAACHGLDARGSERGPDIVSRPEVVDKTDAELAEVLKNGKTASGMPAFSSFGPGKLSGLVAYLRTLQGHSGGAPLPGDPAKGRALFFGKAKCAECHMISGHGGFFGQDLTSYAARRSGSEVRARIVSPDKDLDPRRGMIDVILTDSTKLSGVARSEDNFSLQLQTLDGVFHLLNKSDIRTQNYTGKSAMPPDYGTTLSAGELNDLVSYLLRASAAGHTRKTQNYGEEDEE